MTLITHRLIILTLLLIIVTGSNRILADEWQAASKIVDQASMQMLQLLKTTNSKTELFSGAQSILEPVISFEAIARGVMGKFFRRASTDQRQRFEKVLRQTLLQTYIAVLSAYDIEEFTIKANLVNDNRTNRERVWVKVMADGELFDIYYSMRLIDGQWKLINVVLDGINLGLAFRTQFASAMHSHKNDMDQVIEQWLSS
jgi:phospholipid transport system substrate-binding protein